jgi:plastocyanin
MKYLWTIIGAVVIIGAVWYLVARGPEQNAPVTGEQAISTTTPSQATSTAPTTAAVEGTAEIKEVVIDGSNFAFAPKEVRVPYGAQVKIVFKNTGGTHDLVIDEFAVRTKIIQGDATDSVTFTANKKGSFQYYCSVGSHRAMGMWGTLIVE